MPKYDVIIIGSGIAGLYAAYLLKKYNPSAKFVILEKEDRVGGRVLDLDFHGVNIPMGAGVGRKDKDYLLTELLKELKVETRTALSTHNYTKNIKKEPSFSIYNDIKKKKISGSRMKFDTFGKQMMGAKTYKDFVNAVGYTDFEKMDHVDVMQHYGMEDNMDPLNIIYIPWNKVLDSLVKYIGKENIKCNSEVIALDNTTVKCKNGKKYVATNIICAGTIMTLRKLFHTRIYKEIETQPFLRIYVKFRESSYDIIKKYINRPTVVGPPLQKIIPINPDKGVYMIAYSDNDSAKILHNHIKAYNKKKLHEYLESKISEIFTIDKSLIKIQDSKSHYWTIGTHYFKPLQDSYKTREEFIEKAQRPRDNVYVVGEVVALEQGWCEGALRSVHEIIY